MSYIFCRVSAQSVSESVVTYVNVTSQNNVSAACNVYIGGPMLSATNKRTDEINQLMPDGNKIDGS